MTKDFATTIHCLGRLHCHACRDLEGGRRWRESLRRAFRLPGGEVDFACPAGYGWGDAPSRGLGDTIARAIHAITFGRVKPCAKCRKRQAALNRIAPYRRAPARTTKNP